MNRSATAPVSTLTSTLTSIIDLTFPVDVATVKRSMIPSSTRLSTRFRTVPSEVPTRSAISVYGVLASRRRIDRI